MRLDGLPLAYRSPYLFRLRPRFGEMRARLEWMRHVIEKGSNAVGGLRSSNSEPDDLGQAFSRIPQDLGLEVRIVFRVIVLGSARKLNPLIRDEVYYIGRELLLNAFRHSRAGCIEVELEYAPRRFRLVVRDDGCGIDPQALHARREGHLGLPGMRERAERVGASLTVWSRAAVGTEVALSVPNSIAFKSNGR